MANQTIIVFLLGFVGIISIITAKPVIEKSGNNGRESRKMFLLNQPTNSNEIKIIPLTPAEENQIITTILNQRRRNYQESLKTVNSANNNYQTAFRNAFNGNNNRRYYSPYSTLKLRQLDEYDDSYPLSGYDGDDRFPTVT